MTDNPDSHEFVSQATITYMTAMTNWMGDSCYRNFQSLWSYHKEMLCFCKLRHCSIPSIRPKWYWYSSLRYLWHRLHTFPSRHLQPIWRTCQPFLPKWNWQTLRVFVFYPYELNFFFANVCKEGSAAKLINIFTYCNYFVYFFQKKWLQQC